MAMAMATGVEHTIVWAMSRGRRWALGHLGTWGYKGFGGSLPGTRGDWGIMQLQSAQAEYVNTGIREYALALAESRIDIDLRQVACGRIIVPRIVPRTMGYHARARPPVTACSGKPLVEHSHRENPFGGVAVGDEADKGGEQTKWDEWDEWVSSRGEDSKLAGR